MPIDSGQHGRHTVYKIVEFNHRNELKRVVCDGPDGVSALMAMYNCAALSHMIHQPDPATTSLSEEDINVKLQLLLGHAFNELYSRQDMDRQVLFKNYKDLSAFLLSLPPDFYPEPVPTSMTSFLESDLILLAVHLGLLIVHGWVIDPVEKSVFGTTLSSLTYGKLQQSLADLKLSEHAASSNEARKCELMQGLLAAAEKPFTIHGYDSLHELRDGHFLIFYWNQKFSVIHKNENYLLILETDPIVLEKFPGVTWRTFDKVEGENIYLTSSYSLALNQPNMAKAKQWLSKYKKSGEGVSAPTVLDGQGGTMSRSKKKREREKRKKAAAEQAEKERKDQVDEGLGNTETAEKDQVDEGLGNTETAEKDQVDEGLGNTETSLEWKDQVDEGLGNTETAEKEQKDQVDEGLGNTETAVQPSVMPKVEPLSKTQQRRQDRKARAQEQKEQADKERYEKEQAEKEILEKEQAEKERLAQIEEGELSTICCNFQQFLQLFKDDEGDKMPYFQGCAEALKSTKSPNFYVPYELLKVYDKNLSLKIQDNYPRISEDLNHYVNQFLSEHSVLTPAKLIILGLPRSKSVQAFVDFVNSIAMLEEFIVYVFGPEESPSYLGRKLALGYLDLIITKFQEGRCYGGRWKLENMWVIDDGTSFIIDCEDEVLSDDGGILDLEKYDETVLSLFRTKKGTFPPYFKELREDFKLLPQCRADPKKWKKFLSLIRYPFALKAPLVRSSFVCDVFRAAESEQSVYQDVLHGPLGARTNDWRDIAINRSLLREVYDYKNFANGPWTKVYILTKWGPYYWDLLKFCRHFIAHVLRYFKKKNIDQQARDIIIVDIILGLQLGEFIGPLIRLIVLDCDIDGIFSSAWAHHVASDCFDKPQRSIDMTSIEVELVSDTKMFSHAVGWAMAEVGLTVQKSIVIGNVDILGFENVLRQQHISVTRAVEDGMPCLICGSVRVYKSHRKIEVDSGVFTWDHNSDLVVTVEGPVCDEYYRIFNQLCLWLLM